MGFLAVIVAFFGLVASILAPTFGAVLFLLCTVTLMALGRQEIVKRVMLPWYLGGRAVLFLVGQII